MKKRELFTRLKYFILQIGLDRDILWSIYNKIWTIIKGPIIILVLLNKLNEKEIGLWYTFISLGALTVFAELGFTTIITQFVGHEYANLNRAKLYTNDSDRFFSLISYSIRFYLKIIPVAIVILSIVGYYYFKIENISIIYNWILFSIIGGGSLFLSLLQSIYRGLDKVEYIEKNILLGSVALGLGNLLLLFFDLKISALVFGNLIALLIGLLHLYFLDKEFWKILIFKKSIKTLDWSKQILRLQWRYAISWVSGYFIFHLIIPFIFKYEDKTTAGQYGVTFSILSAIIGLSQSWILTKGPKFNILIARNDFEQLKRLFRRSFTQAISIQLIFSILFIIFIYLVNYLDYFENKFLDLKYVILLVIIQIPVQIINSLAIYLRAFKKEPYLIYSIVNALLNSIGLFFILKPFDLFSFLIYQLIVYLLVLLPYGIYIFKKYSWLYFKKINE